MTITFDSVELKNPEPFEEEDNITINATTLLLGKQAVQSSTEIALSVKFSCLTESFSDISNLRAKIGLKKNLSIDGDTHSCYINSFSFRQEAVGVWIYEVGFIEDTT